ncbi:MAG: VapE domain-containing protein [Pseudomonadota bacterium]
MPILRGKKYPGIRNWQNADASDSAISEWVASGHDGVGVLAATLPAIDIDVIDEDVALALESFCRREFGEALVRVGRAPKRLLIYRTDAPFPKQTSNSYIDASGQRHRIEILGDGQQWVAYAYHPETDKPYQFLGRELTDTPYNELTDLTNANFARLFEEFDRLADEKGWKEVRPTKNSSSKRRPEGCRRLNKVNPLEAAAPPMDSLDIDQAGKILDALPEEWCEEYDPWLRVGMALWHQFEGSDAALALWDEWSTGGSSYQADGPNSCRAKWRGFEPPTDRRPVTMRTIYEAARKANPSITVSRLVCDDRGKPIWNVANAMTVINEHPGWRGVLAFDKFSRSRRLLAPVPGEPRHGFPRDLTDEDYTSGQAWFQRNGFPRADAKAVSDAMRKAAQQNGYNPLTDYLDALKWDEVPRLRKWLSTYCGAKATKYVEEVGFRWMISAVARAYYPGCKVDCMLVLEGAQGAGKSTVPMILAGGTWFSDSLPPMNTKDASSFLRGKWIIEVAELEAMRREIDAVKAFITRQVEKYRPAYGREEVNEPRQCVFIGTTNKDDWIRDETGGRRFWPVRVGWIDKASLTRDRDQLWAEAVYHHRRGNVWWLTDEFEKLARNEVAARHPDDPWTPNVIDAVKGKSAIAPKEVLQNMRLDDCKMTQADAKRVTQILKKLGWKAEGRFSSGQYKGCARYVPPLIEEPSPALQEVE